MAKEVPYQTPPWIANGGNPWSGASWGEGDFDPDAFDPAAPYIPKGGTYRLASNPDKPLEDAFDLENLRFFDRKKVERLLSKLEGLAAEIEDTRSEKQIVGMIGTGGTIAMTKVDGVLQPRLDPAYLLKYAGGGLDERFQIASVEFPKPIDSSQMEIDYAADLVIVTSWIWSKASTSLKQKFSGFLITHGTDTMSGGGAYITMMFGPRCPFSVGIVGAQRTTEDRFSDVGINVKNALETLAMLREARVPAPFVYMGGTGGGAYNPVGVVKQNDDRVDAFASPVHPQIVSAVNFAVSGPVLEFNRKVDAAMGQLGGYDFSPKILRGYAPVINVEPKLATDPSVVYQGIKGTHNAVAVVVTTFGSFTVNHKVVRAVQQATKETGKLFFAANPFPLGSTDHDYGPAHELRKSGAHSVHMMPLALIAKLTLGQHVFGNDLERLAAFVTHNNYVGEQPPSWEAPDDSSANPMAPIGVPREFLIRQ